MQDLLKHKESIHKCSKCGLCQAECPIYQITGNDCTVSRGQFVMLKGLIDGKFKMSKTINRYLDLCLKCGACSKFCPSGIDIIDVIVSAKSEYYKIHSIEKLISFIQKYIIFGIIPNLFQILKPHKKSQKFTKQVVYFGGCGSKFKGDSAVIKLLNKLQIEVINPNFSCCGISLLTRGDLEGFKKALNDYVTILKKQNIKEVVTTCASCEKTLKDYSKWIDDIETKEFLETIEVKNIFEYLNSENLKLKKTEKVTFHKPCNINNFDTIKKLLMNTQNLNYIEMNGFDQCCGLNGLTKLKEYKIMKQIFAKKRNNIKSTGTKIVLTSCLGCETALKAYSFGLYKTYDLIDFLADRIED